MNSYDEYIQNIIDTRGRFNCTGYKERHHIVPKCLNGSDDKSNLIDLYPQEHFIAHKLLAEENPGNDKLFTAYFRMCFCNGKPGIQIDAEEYAKVRTAYSEMRKRTQVGEGNPFYGHKHSDETKEKISKTKKLQSKDPEYIKKLKDSHKGLHPSQKSIELRSEKMRGRKRPQEVKDEISRSKRLSGTGNNHTGKIKISNGKVVKFVYPYDVDDWVNKGFQIISELGRKKYNEAIKENA